MCDAEVRGEQKLFGLCDPEQEQVFLEGNSNDFLKGQRQRVTVEETLVSNLLKSQLPVEMPADIDLGIQNCSRQRAGVFHGEGIWIEPVQADQDRKEQGNTLESIKIRLFFILISALLKKWKKIR